MIDSDKYILLVAQLDDKYRTYDKIGITIVERGYNSWCIKLLLMSCRVMSKGGEAAMLKYTKLTMK